MIQINWYHEGKIIDAASSQRINLDENEGTLTIAEARASDSGRYTCEVASDGGNDRHSANLVSQIIKRVLHKLAA